MFEHHPQGNGHGRLRRKEFVQKVGVSKDWLAERWPNMDLTQRLEAFGRRLFGNQFTGGRVIDEKQDVYVLEVGFWRLV